MRRLVTIRPSASIVIAVTALCLLALAGTALAALQGLPADGSQVNNDPAVGIDPAKGVSGEDPADADVVGGSLVAGNQNVPWAIFRQQTGGKDQVFSRSFANGAWTTRGAGTVGGRSSAAPTFSGSLNFDQSQDGEAPAIDFAGAGRTVPWASWYELTTGTGFGATNIFASRFDKVQNQWIFGGQSRKNGGSGAVVPSLNLHTNRNAENPSIAGGATTAGANPGPWVTWQEEGNSAPGVGKDQIFVVKPIGPATPSCPAGTKPDSGENNVVDGGFCWQQVGIERLGEDPSLNVDRGREAIEPDIAFTGAGDTVPWVVWYEVGAAGDVPTGHSNEMVFAAKALGGAGDGGFHWQVVGSTGTGALDATTHGGACGESAAAEGACSLNANVNANAEDPRVAAGTMNPAGSTVPWVVWDEASGGVDQIFVSRLVGTHFELANHGAPISVGSNPATRPDITFSGNTPYVSWREDTGGSVDEGFSGHFVNAADPTFVLDQANVPLAPQAQADVREPISSSCTANPFDADGAGCQGGALGTPFFLSTHASGGHLALFGNAYQSGAPTTGDAAGVTAGSAAVSGSVNPEGGPVTVQFQFGTSTAYGQTTSPQAIAPTNAVTPFAATLSGFAPGSTVHYRAVVNTDFGTLFGADRTLPAGTPPPGPPPGPPPSKAPKLKLKIAKESLGKLLRTGELGVDATLDEGAKVTLNGDLKVKVPRRHKLRTKLVPVFTQATVSLMGPGSKKVELSLSRKGRKALADLHKATLVITGVATTGGAKATRQATATLKR
jgi:hypothetical protein